MKRSGLPRWLWILCLGAALPMAEGAEEIDPLLDQASAAFQTGNRQEAFSLADKAVERDPKNPKAYYLRARLFEESRQHEKAIADFSQSLKLDPRPEGVYQHRGCEYFKAGKIKESIADFDKFIALVPQQEAHHWQRGIAYYYAGRYEDGRKQFELHQTVNESDVENAVWHYLCVARSAGVEKARKSLIKIESDRRIPMMEIYALFSGKGTPEEAMAAAGKGNPSPEELHQRLFYAHLYLGLYDEANGNGTAAREHIFKAAGQYKSEHYMGDVAQVHADQLRKQIKTD